ncbi:hypothetical protein [Microbulbifer rhizosphaerae]|uniref:Uncharacterized protein n=1 Tax=Microbulbifer rhizosphaerae TaxID=1562603 RepID=A0A7W4WF37_9GAMM|nr:hypothetical protein [Microbulbifer rhizosphaerae]MBB3062617.1 hypothetical protein [Microbulbifer rhizosphaerae]
MRCAATILLCLTTGWAQDRFGQLPASATEIRVRGDTYVKEEYLACVNDSSSRRRY